MQNTGVNPDEHVMSQSGHDIEIKMPNGGTSTRHMDDYHVDRRGAYTIAV